MTAPTLSVGDGRVDLVAVVEAHEHEPINRERSQDPNDHQQLLVK
jgi:hypothetical protein